MQGKGFIKTLAVILGLICLSYLSHTAYVQWQESKACELSSDGSDAEIDKQLAILGKDTLNLGITKYNYWDSKKKEMNLGLDLKGGMNVMLEISVKDLLLKMADKSEDPTFRKALANTDEAIKNSSEGYHTLFFKEFEALKTANGGKPNLADYNIFGNRNNVDKINTNLTDAEAKKIINEDVEASIGTAYDVFRTRIDRFGVAQPNIQRVPGTGRILVELPGAKNKERIKKLLQTSAQLQFWKVDNSGAANQYISQISTDTVKANNLINLLNIAKVNTGEISAGGGLGAVRISDTAKVNAILKSPIAKSKLPANLKYSKFLWASKPESDSPDYLGLFCIESNKKEECAQIDN